ncbi:hypothetical protein [Mycolicibacterium pyrenivorans]|uniref:hypothetical protein n=1 Tax=Mycolicibacterium pyrenivorans TaxID=187102 RepID=UPI0021F336B0|nr:hypothetical protein [Mycolicibacterium pyrenivorans]MCV7153873.1 hypothetical protein [Mycolicibacterium pyrenivorans]
MGSRARATAAACLVASGLLAGGLTTATAFADPPGPTARDDTSEGGPDAAPPGRQIGGGTTAGDRDDGGDRGDRADRGIVSAPEGGDAREEGDAPEAGDAPAAGEEPEDGDAAAAGDESDSTADVSRGRDLEVPLSEAREEAEPRLPWPPCCAKGEKDCWPWPWPEPEPDPDGPPKSDNDGGGFPDLPVGLPFPGPVFGVPPELVPPTGEPLFPDVVDTVPGVGVAVSTPAGGPISLPVLIAAPTGSGAAAGPVGGSGAGMPAAPRQGTADPMPARQPLPATAAGNVAMPASYRVGYGEYLRTAGIPQIAALAVPGVAGILVLTATGGLLGYRQAKAGRAVCTTRSVRFMN